MNTVATSAPVKRANLNHPIQELLAERWSPYGFSDRAVSDRDLASLFEAARWAASSYNEQPWTYIVATRAQVPDFNRVLSCLVPGNQAWAKAAPVLVLGVVRQKFAHNNQDNRAAVHDLGLASANLVMEATARGISVHQMIGLVPEKVRELYRLPEHVEAWTAMALGYSANSDEMPDALRQRDLAPRQRKPIEEFVFGGTWGQPAVFAVSVPHE